jgi:hypothetical protein
MKYVKSLLLLLILCTVTNLSYAPPIPKEVIIERDYNIGVQRINSLLKQNEEAIEALGMFESNMDYTVYNEINALGCWQFIPGTMKFFGYGHITPAKFKANPNIFPQELQREVLQKKINYDIDILTSQYWRKKSTNYFEKYVGTTINGVKVTRFGILAMAHLGGVGGAIRFFDKAENPADINGTRLFDYLKKFSQYDYTDERILNKELKCLDYKRSYRKYALYYEQTFSYKWKTTLSFQNGMEIALILEHQKMSTSQGDLLLSWKSYPLELKRHYLNTIQGCLNQEVQHVLNMGSGLEIQRVKLNTTIQILGKHFSLGTVSQSI